MISAGISSPTAPPCSEAIRRAFDDPASESAATRTLQLQGDRLVLSDGWRRLTVARPDFRGTPSHPALSQDGSRVAWLARKDECDTVLYGDVRRGLLHNLRLDNTRQLGINMRIQAVDLSPSGRSVACLGTDRVGVYGIEEPLMKVHVLPPAAPQALLVKQSPRDVEYTTDGLAILTDAGTAYLVRDDGTATALSLPHPNAPATPGLTEQQRTTLLDTYGDALVSVFSAPGGRHSLLQMRQSVSAHDDTICSLVHDNVTGAVIPIGVGPAHPPLWSPDGRFVAVGTHDGILVAQMFGDKRPFAASISGMHWTSDSQSLIAADGRSLPLTDAFSTYEMFLGSSAPRPTGGVVQELQRVLINGLSVPRRCYPLERK